MPLPEFLQGVSALNAVGKLLAGGGIAAALFAIGRLFLKAKVVETWLWLAAMFAFFLSGLALLGLVELNPGRALDLGRIAWGFTRWLARTTGVHI